MISKTYSNIFLWILLLLLQVTQILFASILTYFIFENEVTIWAGNNEIAFGILVYGGGLLSYPIAGYLLFITGNYFQKKNIKLFYVLILSIVLGLVLSAKYIFPFGTLLIFLFFLVVIVVTGMDIFNFKKHKE